MKNHKITKSRNHRGRGYVISCDKEIKEFKEIKDIKEFPLLISLNSLNSLQSLLAQHDIEPTSDNQRLFLDRAL